MAEVRPRLSGIPALQPAHREIRQLLCRDQLQKCTACRVPSPDDFIAPPACCTQGSHRDKRAKTSGAIVDPMDEEQGQDGYQDKGCAFCGGLGHRVATCPKLEQARMKQIMGQGNSSDLAGGAKPPDPTDEPPPLQ